VTSIRNEHDAIFDAQRDRAQVRDAIAHVRARARWREDSRERSRRVGLARFIHSGNARREAPPEGRLSPVERDTDEDDFLPSRRAPIAIRRARTSR